MIPINVDRNVSPSAFHNVAATEQLMVTSIFYTVQGEGPLAGRPAVFLRLAGCNIGTKQDCPFCDTRFHLGEARRMHIADVMAEIKLAALGRTDLVVVTGGEPLLQAPMMLQLIGGDGFTWEWQFETNGYYLKPDVVNDFRTIHDRVSFVVSPKIPHGRLQYPSMPLAHWPNEDVCLKYVVSADMASGYFAIGPSNAGRTVYVSAMTVYKRACVPGEVANIWDDTLIDREATARNYRHAAKLVANGGGDLRLSYQTHLFGALE